MKKLLALLLALVMAVAVFTACGDGNKPSGGASADKDPYTGIAYSSDTVYDYLYSAEITTMNYLTTSVTYNQISLANFIDTLVEYDAFGNVVPCLAENWNVSEDGLTWTFNLRENAKWFTCEGEEYAPLTAHDFVYALHLVCDVDFGSDMPNLVTDYLVNGNEIYSGEITDFSQLGVEAKDDYTLVFQLKAPCPYFLSLLTYGCYMPINGAFYESLMVEPAEATVAPEATPGEGEEEEVLDNTFGTDRDKILYCGAYICSSWEPQQEYVWDKNENYWDAEHVYLTCINGKYNAQADSIAPEMFLRGEIDSCKITTTILDDWLEGENAEYVHGSKKDARIMYMLFNFNPNFDDKAASDNYRVAVNNKNFRMSIVHGLNKTYCVSPYDPHNAEALVTNLMIPVNFANCEGKDYTQYGKLPELAKGFYDEELAKQYRDTAKQELAAEGVKFPIEIPVFYNPSEPNMDQSCQLLEKQLEDVLGNDFINITVYAGPSTNFIGEVRRPGLWGLFEAGWGPDFADPSTYFDPFGYGWTYGSQEFILGDEYKTGHIYTEEDYKSGVISDEELIGQPQFVFNSLVEAARAESSDMNARFEKFALAEQYAIEEALLMPFRQYNEGYVASRLTVFDRQDAMAGICSYRYKGMRLLEKSYNMEEFNKAYEAWEKAKAN